MRKFLLLILVLGLNLFSAAAQTKLTRQFASRAMNAQIKVTDVDELGFCPGAFYANNDGVGNYYIILTSVPSNYDSSDGSIELSDAGWCLMLDIYGDPTTPIEIPAGTYVASEDCVAGTYYPEYSYAFYQNEEGEGEAFDLVGDIKVAVDENGLYTIDAMVDHASGPMPARFIGNLNFTDTNGESELLPTFKENLDLKFTGSFAWYYGNLYQANTGNMLVNLYDCEFDEETGSHTGIGYCLQLCLFDILFKDSKEAKVQEGTYTMARNFQRDTWFPGMPVDYLGTTLIMGSFCQKHAADGSYSYAYMSEGTVVIEDLENGEFKLTVDLLTDAGCTIKGEYVGVIPVTDVSEDNKGAVISTLEQDYELTLDSIPVARVWKYEEVNGCSRFVMDIGSPSGLDEWVEKNGGDIFRIDILSDAGAEMFNSGTYTVMEDKYATSYAPGKLLRGFFEDGGDLRGTRWFHFEEGRYMVADGLAPAYGGEVKIQYLGQSRYKVDINVVDDGGFQITGAWTGPIECQFEVPTGIERSQAEPQFTYYDNETVLLGKVAPTDRICVYSTDGTLVKTQIGNGTIRLNNLPKGIYIVRASHQQTFKIMKR